MLFGLFASFILIFMYSLGATFGARATITAISTLVSSALLLALKPFRF